MTASNFVNPTYYNLQKATIRSEFSNVVDYDITALIPSLSISASIDSETMFGSARIVDSVGLLDGSNGREPLRGEEQLILELVDSKTINETGGLETGTVETPFRFIGFIYKIDNIKSKDTNDVVTYDIHFISYQSFKAGTYELIRSFKDQSVSEIVRTLFQEYYLNSDVRNSFEEKSDVKDLILEKTEGVIRCWIPKMRPEEAMGFLSKRSYSEESPSCLFRFFESSRGYHFVTDEELYRLSKTDEKRLFAFTYLDAIPDTLEYFDQQLNNLETIENTKRVNSLDDIYNGAYRNKVYELDILSRTLNLLDNSNQYDYFDARSSYLEAPGRFQRLADRHTKKFINSIHRGDDDVQKEWLVVQNYTTGESSGDNALQAETYYADIIANRAAYSKHIESITINARGPGRFDVTAGDIIELTIKDFVFADDSETKTFKENKYLTGNYIVRSVTHNMQYEEMYNSYVLIKRDWSQTELLTQDEIDRILADTDQAGRIRGGL